MPGVRARLGARRSRIPRSTSRRASDDDELLAASARAMPGHVADLRLLDRERRRLADLPAHELLEIRRARRHLLEPHQRHLGDGVGHDQADRAAAGRPARARAPSAPHDRRAIVDVGRRQRRHERAVGQRLDGVRGDDGLAAAPVEAAPPTRVPAAISTATPGGGVLAQRVTGGSFDERHLVDLAQRGHARAARARPPIRAGTASPPRAPPS